MKKANEFKVGLLVLTGILIFLAAHWIIRGVSFSNEGYTIYVQFKSVSGLKVGDHVRMAEGVKIGKVNDIEMKNNLANAKLWIKRGVKISTESSFTISSASFFGEKFISVTHVVDKGTLLNGGETLRGQDPISLMGSLTEFGKLMKNLNTLVGGDNSDFINNLTKTVKNSTQKIENILARGSNDILRTLKNFSQASSKINTLSRDFISIGKKLDKLLTTFQHAGNSINRNLPSSLLALKKSASTLATILRKVNNGKGVLSSVINDRKLYYDIKFILENLKLFTFKLRRDPSILLWKNKK